MWAKLSGALKPRPETPSLGDQDDNPNHTDVLAGVYEQHPNLSVFHQDSVDVPFPSSSPPVSPTLTGRKNIFQRPKALRIDTSEQAASPPVMSPLTLPKKVKSSFQNLANVSELSLGRSSVDSANGPVQMDKPKTPTTDFKFGSLRSLRRDRGSGESIHSSQPSQDSTNSALSLKEKTPITPTTDAKFSSLRSILRDRHTPATGQSVRFFSRDAYKVITPDVSATSSEPEEMSFAARLHRAKQHRPAAQELFSAPATPSLLTEMPPPDVSNIFDMSMDAEPFAIPPGVVAPLLDNAVEISEAEAGATPARPETVAEEPDERPPTPPAKTEPIPHGLHDRSQSFSFGQTVFRSMNAESTPALGHSVSLRKRDRNRASSDTMFHAMVSSTPNALPATPPPEADINDTSGAMIVYSSPEREKEKDPFGAHATTYYTPGTVLPPTPPQAPKETHARKASREEDLIWSLRTQLALQSELCVQFEVDLGARDELVRVLTTRLEETERECERRKNVVKSWRKRVAELEKCVRGLQEEVERSREESLERSTLDEASGEALRMLHRRIEALEREKTEMGRKENEAREELEERNTEAQRLREELEKKEQSERELRAGINAAKEEMEEMGDLAAMQQANVRQSLLVEEVERQHTAAESAWQEERERLLLEMDELRNAHTSVQTQLTDAREDVMRKDEELGVLKAELEAQWKHTEEAGEKTRELTRERDDLRTEVDELNERISNMELDWNQTENKKIELDNELQDVWAAKEDLERERNELEDQLRSEHEHAENLTQALQEREDRVTALEQERQYALDRAARFETQLKQRDTETAELSERASAREKEVETVQEEMGRMKREHARIVNEQSRTLQDVVAREVEARAAMEGLVREKAETDVLMGNLKERMNALQEETERLRRQVHALQQESADKEVKLVNLAKQRKQDKDDLEGLNIALDSKQQELELLKRKIGVRGTAGSTPAPSKTLQQRRESSIFGTPTTGGSRPPSVLSDAGTATKERKLSDTPSTITKPTLTKSVRANASGATVTAKRSIEGAMGPPPITRTPSAGGVTPTRSRIPSSGPRASISGMPSSFTKPSPGSARRMSVAEPSRLRPSAGSRSQLSSASEADEKEKENAAPEAKTRRMSVAAV